MQTNNKKTNKKIGILTFHFAHNLGAVLQCYALQKHLDSYVDCKVINYRPKYHVETYDLSLYKPEYFPSKVFKSILSTQKKPVGYLKASYITFKMLLDKEKSSVRKNYKKKVKKFNKFINRIPQTKLYETFEQVEQNLNFDVIITGSDQLWNKQLFPSREFDKVYFLNFNAPNVKKVSYAISAGGVFSEENYSLVENYIKNLDICSVREPSLCEFLNDKGCEARVDCDPTFLLKKQDYKKLQTNKKIKEKFIFVYFTYFDKEMEELILRVMEEQKINKVIMASPTIITNYSFPKNFYFDKCCGVSDFLNYIDKAECVISSSFHGMVFSVIYNKKFVVYPHYSSRRLTDFLTKLDLQDHVYSKDKKIILDVNYQDVNLKLQNMVKDSYSYIDTIVKDC